MITGAVVLYQDRRHDDGMIHLEAQFLTDGGEAEDLPTDMQDRIGHQFARAMGRSSDGIDEVTRSELNLPLLLFREKQSSRRGASPANELAVVLSEVLEGTNVDVHIAQGSIACERLEAA